MKRYRITATALLLAQFLTPAAQADQRTELLEMKNTILNLVDALVDEGILSAEKASTIKTEAAARARTDAARETEVEPPIDPADATASSSASKVVRVPYVPEFVKDEIREELRAELREDVTADVVATAKEERWGVKDALPAWVNDVTLYGDLRLRYQGHYYGGANIPNSVPNFQAINEAGGITSAGQNAFRNTTEDRHRQRVRARLGLDIAVAEKVRGGLRLITGRLDNPISLNETLGRQGEPIEFNVDRLWIAWNEDDRDGFSRFFVSGGRIPNPYFTPSDLVWDNDLAFEGVAANLRQPLPFIDQMAGPLSAKRHVFLNFGAYPIDDNELAVDDNSSNDKWLWGAQAGIDFAFTPTSAATAAVAFHDYINITGRRNSFNSVLNDWTAPRGLARGNTLFDIRNDLDLNTELFALAADFTLLNVSAQYRYSGFDPIDIWLTGDIVKNIGYDEQDILRRTGVRVPERSLGYWLGLTIGTACDHSESPFTHCITGAGDWTLFGGYRYLQRDAVIDAFTDSNFHLGGTNTKGYQIGLDYGLTRHTWLRTRWMSADEIDGVPYGLDILQVDVNAKF